MSITFSQIYIQVIFAIRGRENMIQASWEKDLFKYISGIVRNKEQKILAFNGIARSYLFFEWNKTFMLFVCHGKGSQKIIKRIYQ